MNVRERLKEAYENVSFSADRTWSNAPNAYQKNNMELYLTEHHVQINKLQRNRPRTVREAIPKSRLAQYANYVYNESREMSYASSTTNSEPNLSIRVPTEPWEMPEVGELYRWFLKNQPEDSFSRLEGKYESPLLSVSGFEDKILKIQITEDRVKNIWKKSYQYEEFQTKSATVLVKAFTSPLKNVFLFKNEDSNHEWFRDISISRDFDQVEQLCRSFKDQTTSISKFLMGDTDPSPSEPTSTEVLYSEVLQGLSPSRKFLSSLKPDPGKSLSTDETSSISQDSFTNYTILNSHKLDEPKPDAFPQSTLPKVSQFTPVPPSATKFVPQKVFFQTDTRYKYPMPPPVDPNQRNPRSMVHSSYVQQYFYSPVQTVQRWIPSNFSSYYPTQIFTSNWFAQNPVVNRIFGPLVSADREGNVFSRVLEEGHFKEESMEVDPFVEEHQVSTSISEELEIQALEQYSNSNENFYQELERQAAEQYASSPE
ncbi:uncharacterized protein LOC135126431 [Zophobas morio]|uniref:uncharacterized protein LOC135126431 n=1 Tax=Zophobas morio TaxID=2755281 RepID=UPI0030832A08